MSENLYLRGKTWWGRTTYKGREFRQSLKTTSRDVAESRVKLWIENLRGDLDGAAAARSFEAMATFFLDERLPMLKPQSADRYRQSLRFLVVHFEDLKLGDINAETLTAFVKSRRRDGVKPPTIRRDLACLGALITFYLEEHDLEHGNPVNRFLKKAKRRGTLRESEPRRRYLDHTEEARLIETATRRAQGDARLRGFAGELAFAIDTGLRLEEQFGLLWPQVNLTSGYVRVVGDRAKSHATRDVPLLRRSAQILAQLPRHLRRPGEPDYVFAKSNGARRGDRDKAFASLCQAAEITDIRWHDLRRTCGCRLKQDHGKSFDEISQWLGHATVEQTKRAYAFLRLDDLRVNEVGTTIGTGRQE